MRLRLFMAMAYLAGVHGFAFFVPYLVVFAAAVHLIRSRQRVALAAAQVPVPA